MTHFSGKDSVLYSTTEPAPARNRFVKRLQQNKRLGVVPFFMLGDPNPDLSLKLIKTAIDQGVDALELGIPFSDPIADGPVIQRSAERALKAGANFKVCLSLLKQIRAYTDLPIGLLMYYNLLLGQGVDQVYRDLAAVPVDGILAVDLPMEEANDHLVLLNKYGIGNISLIAPNTSLVRAEQLLRQADAFAYVVSRFGITGVSQSLPQTLPQRLTELKRIADGVPLIVGFGVSAAEQVKALRQAGADSVIIGSAITKLIEADLADPVMMLNAVQQFLQDLRN